MRAKQQAQIDNIDAKNYMFACDSSNQIRSENYMLVCDSSNQIRSEIPAKKRRSEISTRCK
jgi:hypothetical protein